MSSPYIPGIPVEVQNIKVGGNARTKLHFFEKELEEAIISSNTVDQLHQKLDVVVDRLHSYGIFDAVHANIDITTTDVLDNKYKVDVQLDVKEKGVPQLKLESYIRTGINAVGDVGLEAQGTLRNPFGYGDVFSIKAGTTPLGSREYLTTISVPYPAPMLKNITFTGKSSHDNLAIFTGFQQKDTGISLQSVLNPFDLKRYFGINADKFLQKVECSFSVRDEIPISHPTLPHTSVASEAILLTAQASTKAALKYSCSYDTRNKGANSSKGQYVETSIEAALPLGTTQFVKSDIRLETHHEIGPKLYGQDGLSVSYSAAFGYLYAPRGFVCLTDRYYLGGPMSLRGFRMYGCGPRSTSSSPNQVAQSYPTGGNTKTLFVGMLHCPIPIRSLAESGCRSFLFINAGSIGYGFGHSSSFGNMRASLGVGGSFAFGPARFECTYSLPVLRSEHDVTKQFQFGAGLTIV